MWSTAFDLGLSSFKDHLESLIPSLSLMARLIVISQYSHFSIHETFTPGELPIDIPKLKPVIILPFLIFYVLAFFHTVERPYFYEG